MELNADGTPKRQGVIHGYSTLKHRRYLMENEDSPEVYTGALGWDPCDIPIAWDRDE